MSEEIKSEVPVTGGKKKEEDKEKKQAEELSEEDLALKDGLELAVARLREEDDSLHKPALDHLVNEIRSSTSSMTSVPKPLKFLRPHYDSLKMIYEAWPANHAMKTLMADVLSVLAMTMAAPGSRECLKFKLVGTHVNVSSWGHEYVRSLSGEIAEEFNQRLLEAETEEDAHTEDLLRLVDDILPFQMQHNAEAEAVDLLLEVRQLSKLVDSPVVDERNYERVCLYLIRSSNYIVDPEDLDVLYETTFSIYKTQKKFTDAMRVAIRMNSDEHVLELLQNSSASDVEKKQMAFILARHRSHISTDNEELNELIGNGKLSEQFLEVATSMDILNPKVPEDIYKSSSKPKPLYGQNVDSVRANLASTFVNAFVNAGFCKDKLMTEEDSNWLFKNKGHGMISAAASLGMVMLWNVDEGLNQIDKYFHHNEDFAKAGACLGVGIISSGVRNESDPALALLSEFVDNAGVSTNVRQTSILGLGLAYAGSQRDEIRELLEGIIVNTESNNITEASFAALSLGLIFVGTCNDDISSIILQRLMESSEADLNSTLSRFMCLGLGLLFLGQGEKADAVLEGIRVIEHQRGKYAELTLLTCAYAGTGNVLKVQSFLGICTEHLTENAEHQSVAVLGLALAAVGEDIGTDMTLRTFEHLLHYGELPIRRVVPLALALLFISNPEYSIIDQFSRLSHDQDAELSQCAILGLGLVSAGSNNSRVANMLRQLAEFYASQADHLFLVRIAQGLNAMGKGLVGLNPFHSDRYDLIVFD